MYYIDMSVSEEPSIEKEVEQMVDQLIEQIAEPEPEPDVEIENIYLTFEESGSLNPLLEDKSPEDMGHVIFIVPYRDRENHLVFFKPHMAQLLSRLKYKYQIFFLHQKDKRSFNRGAIKNIGFRVVKDLYPETYKDITLVFHDIDSLLSTLVDGVDFRTKKGIIKHFYGFRHTLGGIFSITAGDFEEINGFPNFWTWGYEDNLIQLRAKNANIKIDRTIFYDTKVGPSRIIRLYQNSIREVNRAEYDRYNQLTVEGVDSITGIQYLIRPETGFVDVTDFSTGVEEATTLTKDFDLIYGAKPFDISAKTVIQTHFRMMNVSLNGDSQQKPPTPVSNTAETMTYEPMFPMNANRPKRQAPRMSMLL